MHLCSVCVSSPDKCSLRLIGPHRGIFEAGENVSILNYLYRLT